MERMKLNIQMFAQEILTDTNGSGTSPKVHWWVQVTPSNRTVNSVTISCTIYYKPIASNWGSSAALLYGKII